MLSDRSSPVNESCLSLFQGIVIVKVKKPHSHVPNSLRLSTALKWQEGGGGGLWEAYNSRGL